MIRQKMQDMVEGTDPGGAGFGAHRGMGYVKSSVYLAHIFTDEIPDLLPVVVLTTQT